jgi:hypothetical protein
MNPELAWIPEVAVDRIAEALIKAQRETPESAGELTKIIVDTSTSHGAHLSHEQNALTIAQLAAALLIRAAAK